MAAPVFGPPIPVRRRVPGYARASRDDDERGRRDTAPVNRASRANGRAAWPRVALRRAPLWRRPAMGCKEVFDMPKASVNGIQLHYEEAGQGLPLVFVHEFAGDLRSWQ